jgi:GT2 family glycosyltransferase
VNHAPRVCAVVLNWNRAEDTLACLESLKREASASLTVLVIDNGSDDDSVPRLQAAVPAANFIAQPKNRGFAAGCNIGIRRALGERADYVWLLNNDAQVMPGCLRALTRKAEEDPKLGAVGSVLYSGQHPDTIEAWGGGRIYSNLGGTRHIYGPDAKEPDYLVGASLLLRCRALKQVGLLDERFFLYWEDTDLCQRLIAAGWSLATAKDARVVHAGSASLKKSQDRLDFLFNRSAALYFLKHHPWPCLPIVIGGLARSIKRLFKGEGRRFIAVWCGLLAGLRRRPNSVA